MSKTSKTEGMSIQYRREVGMSTPNGIAMQTVAGSNASDFFQIELAEVIDIIYNTEHPDFASGSDIGKIKIRFIHEKGSDETELSWAYPINPYLVSYPIKHEAVYVINLLGTHFYIGNINYSGSTIGADFTKFL